MALEDKILKQLKRGPLRFAQLQIVLPQQAALGPALDKMVRDGVLQKNGRLYSIAAANAQPDIKMGLQGRRARQPQKTGGVAFAPAQRKALETAGKSKSYAAEDISTTIGRENNAGGNKRHTGGAVKGTGVANGGAIAKGGVVARGNAVARGGAVAKGGVVARGNAVATQNQVEATIVKLHPTYGFARTEGGEDIFVPGKFMLGAMPKDRVLLAVTSYNNGAKQEGRVKEITQMQPEFTGTVEEENGYLVFCPAGSTGIAIQFSGSTKTVKAKDKVQVRLTRGGSHYAHRAAVIAVFGSGNSAAGSSAAILYNAGIYPAFLPPVLTEAEHIAKKGIDEQEISHRKNYTDLPIFTIDGANTKDIDDAISIQRLPVGYLLGVHIADVSHYVKPGSELDKDAFSRGTSVYYANSVVPMLPKELSNGICSLNPGAVRLSFSCMVQLNEKGEYISATFEKSVIKSRLQGVYTEVNSIFAGEEQFLEKYKMLLPVLQIMRELYEKLAALRAARGNLDIHTHEAAIKVDGNGVAIGVEKRETGIAEAMIEEFMLQANGAAARFAKASGLPFVYRVHPQPEADRLEALQNTLHQLGLSTGFLPGAIPTQHQLAAILNSAANTPLEKAVHLAVLRTMPKATYEPTPGGHYGLALADYAQFTSPIRRYADLAIHRILTAFLQSASAQKVTARYAKFAAAAAKQATAREIAAIAAERDCEDCYKAEYMQNFVGQVFSGIVIAIPAHGVYVELDNTVEGLLSGRVLAQAGYSYVEGVGYTAAGQKNLQVGSLTRVKVAGVSVSQGHIDFSFT